MKKIKLLNGKEFNVTDDSRPDNINIITSEFATADTIKENFTNANLLTFWFDGVKTENVCINGDIKAWSSGVDVFIYVPTKYMSESEKNSVRIDALEEAIIEMSGVVYA